MSDSRCLADSQTPPVSYIAAVYIQTAERQTDLSRQAVVTWYAPLHFAIRYTNSLKSATLFITNQLFLSCLWASSQNCLVSVCPSVHLKQLCSHWTDLH